MKRREFIAGLSSTVASPVVAWAQAALPEIGFLNGGAAWEAASFTTAFLQGLNGAGYVEDGRNVRIEYRWAEGRSIADVGSRSDT
jgi:putative tryptophan/tyrosine transport system substrate-binding protein